MEDDDKDTADLDMYRPGTSKPPHHRHHTQEDLANRPATDHGVSDDQCPVSRSADHKKMQSVNQWTVNASETVDGSSPVKKPALPQVETVDDETPAKGGNAAEMEVEFRGPRYSSHHSYSDMLDNMSGKDPFKGDYQSSGKSKVSKLPKRKKHAHSRQHSADPIPMSEVTETRKLKKRSRSKQNTSEIVNSTETYVVDTGVVNEAYEDGGADRRRRKKKMKKWVSEDHMSNATYTLSEGEPDSQGLKESFTKFINKFQSVKSTCRQEHAPNTVNERRVAKFIYKKIKQRECDKYARNKYSKNNNCQCGRDVEWHEDAQIRVNLSSEHEIWNTKTHTKTTPCDSFGEIVFRGFGHDVTNSPYIRMDCVTDLEDIWKVLTKIWQLPIPQLIISVTGGAKRFDLKPRLRNLLKEGLTHAAASTGAWIITGGTATGVMEFVGEAVRDHMVSMGSTGQNRLVALGIATWGVIANRFALDGEGERGLFPATYAMEDVDHAEMSGKSMSALDHNHTHFILVDDGTEGKYGAEIKLRTKLESYISKKVETGVAQTQSMHVPNVLIVVEGGINTMKTVSESIKRKTPIVVIQGSGRAAEFIALGYKLTRSKNDGEKTIFPPDFDSIMLERAASMFVWKTTDTDVDRKMNECLRNLRDSLEHRRLINVLNLDDANSNKDIDRAILYALLRANKSNANSQLALALAWNRCDIARQEIFTVANRKQWQKADLFDAMVTALVQDRTDFVQLFIDNGLDVKRFLTIETLWNLYANVVKDMGDNQSELIRNIISYLKQSWASYLCCQTATRWQHSPDLLKNIGKVVIHLLRDQSMVLYADAKYVVSRKEGPTMSWLGDRGATKPLLSRISTRDLDGHQPLSHRSKLKGQEKYDFSNPEKHLFLWAVLFNRRQLAQLFWKLGNDHLSSGLVACSILKMLSEEAEDEEELDLSADLADHAVQFEHQAFGVLSECYNQDKRTTHQLLVCEQRQWGHSTMFTMAEAHTLMDFVEHSACQTKLNDIWKGRMALYTPELKIILSIIFPIMIPSIKFTSNTSLDDMFLGDDSDDEEFEEDDDVTSPGRLTSPRKVNPIDSPIDPTTADDDQDLFSPSKSRRSKKRSKTKLYSVNLLDFTSNNINIFTAIFYFYAAPVTKFYCNVGSYIVFLLIFSYFVLIDLRPATEVDSPSLWEMITWAWLSTMLLEECRQIFIRDQRSAQYKIRSWFSNVWNRFDLLIYSLFIMSVVLRYNLFTTSFIWARMSYSITLALFYLRFMQYFFAARNMGPKVIMIRKMLTDLVFFFLILLVFVVSFGVAYHVNLYPNHVFNYKVLLNVLYLPYWQMYGELFLERVEGEDDPNSCTRNETLWRAELLPRCPEKSGLVTLLLAVYMILTNILLVNLLIAMFSYTFQTVQDNSMKIWRFYRLSLVYEYFDRPTLVPPIIILNHLYRASMWIFHTFCHNCTRCRRLNAFSRDHGPTTLGGKIEERLEESEYARLRIFEKVAVNNYLSRSMIQQREQLDNRVANTAERIETVMYELALIKESVASPAGRQVTEDQDEKLMPRQDVKPQLSDRPSTNETAYLRQCVDDLTEQVGQQTLRLSQMSHMMEMLVGSQSQRSSRSHDGTNRVSRRNVHGLTISDVTPTEEEV